VLFRQCAQHTDDNDLRQILLTVLTGFHKRPQVEEMCDLNHLFRFAVASDLCITTAFRLACSKFREQG
jgi:hypothetical protein